jgi:hypothetical protein
LKATCEADTSLPATLLEYVNCSKPEKKRNFVMNIDINMNINSGTYNFNVVVDLTIVYKT